MTATVHSTAEKVKFSSVPFLVCEEKVRISSFFSSLTKERVSKLIYKARELVDNLFDYIEVFYNRTGRSSRFTEFCFAAVERVES
jgi:putative transposase